MIFGEEPEPVNEEKILTAAQGYIELEMAREALQELRLLPQAQFDSPDSLLLRVVALIRLKRWKSAVAVAHKICEVRPRDDAGFIHMAYCYHEMGKTQRAKEILLSAPRAVQGSATFCYNLACYEAVLGNLEAARHLLEESIRMDVRFREYARTDRDLAVLFKEQNPKAPEASS